MSNGHRRSVSRAVDLSFREDPNKPNQRDPCKRECVLRKNVVIIIIACDCLAFKVSELGRSSYNRVNAACRLSQNAHAHKQQVNFNRIRLAHCVLCG